jgi:hypothetical protein
MGALVYVTHAAGRFEANLERNGRLARWIGGARKAILLRRADLEADSIYAAHRDVFDAAGRWLLGVEAMGHPARDGSERA